MTTTETNFLEHLGFEQEKILKLTAVEEEIDLSKEYTFVDFIVSIGQSGENLMIEPHDVDYVAKRYNEHRFGIRRYFSNFADTIFFVNEMSIRPYISPRMEYSYLLHAVPKRKRYYEKTAKNQEKIKKIMDTFGYSYSKAKQIEHIVEF